MEIYLECEASSGFKFYDEDKERETELPKGKYKLYGTQLGSRREGERDIRWDHVVSYRIQNWSKNQLAVISSDEFEKLRQEDKIVITN